MTESVRRRPVIRLRPPLFALAVTSSLVAVVAFVKAIPDVWTTDAHRNMAAADAIVHGSFGNVPEYLYSPLAALLTVPALLVPDGVAIGGWLLLKLAILAVGVAIATRGFELVDRVLFGIAAIAFLPILYDLELGNVTVLVVAAIVVVAWTPDRLVAGIPMGLILATAPKPNLVPVLLWMAIANRRALMGAIGTAAVATLAGIAVAGPAAYATWIAILRAPSYLTQGPVINLAIWSQPVFVVVPAVVVTLVAFGLALRRGYWPGLVGALCAGLLLAPYTLIYGAGVFLAAAPAAARATPRVTLVLAIVALIALSVVFQAWVGAVLAVAVLLPAAAWPPAPAATSGRPAVAESLD